VVTSRGLVLVALAAALPAGCAFGSPAAPQLTTYRGHGITFTYPASWRSHEGFVYSLGPREVELASQPTPNRCMPHACWFPIRHLRPGAVVVAWSLGEPISGAHPPTPGVHVTVPRGGCPALAGDEALIARVVLPGRRVYEATACIRGPGVQIEEREVRAMLASARRTRP
jgi:hypothetical protein